jgi:DNA topoisomerase I
MSYELIITEKPSAAKKIAEALADGKAIKKGDKGVAYYDITHGKQDILVGCAVGHLYTVAEDKVEDKNGKKKGWTYPVFDVKWDASSKVRKDAKFTSKYVSVLKKLAKQCKTFTVATDFDIEGEVIGLNVVKFICKKKDARRMKYSTLTKPELIKSYENASPTLDWGQAHAGTTRHVLDFYYGINLSRALTLAVKTTGMFKILSSGRVQGPALKIIVDKEKEIKAFVPEPYWQLELHGSPEKEKDKKIVALHKEDKFWDKKKAKKVYDKVKDEKQGEVADLTKKQFKQAPPAPFDLTTLQTEAYRSLGIQPKEALALAQELYLKGIISYPRTSSQVLPPEIGFSKILNLIKNQEYYRGYAEKLLAKGNNLKPNNGKKKDPAHPAIYPTGHIEYIEGREAKVYDLIVRRFLATFSDPATRETVTMTVEVKKEPFIAKGTRTIERGWHEFYGHHVKLEEEELPAVQQGDAILIQEMLMLDKETSPPKRYTPASIIKALEKQGLGTKATRAQIVDNLYQRGYVHEKSIQATELGIRTCEILENYCPDILDSELTKHFEEEMEKIREEKKKGEAVLEDAEKILTKILKKFKKQEKEIGKELAAATKETRDELSYLGKCPKCKKGELHMRRGRFGLFAGCNKHPECKTAIGLPRGGLVKSAKQECEACKFPKVQLLKRGKKPQILCLNKECPSKQVDEEKAKEQEKPCPKCDGKLIIRHSIYGSFLGCTNYPKCRANEKIEIEKKKEGQSGNEGHHEG